MYVFGFERVIEIVYICFQNGPKSSLLSYASVYITDHPCCYKHAQDANKYSNRFTEAREEGIVVRNLYHRRISLMNQNKGNGVKLQSMRCLSTHR